MKKLVKSAVVFASLVFIGTSATMITEKASAASIDPVQKADGQATYIPKGVRDGTATEEHDGFEDGTNSVLQQVPLLRQQQDTLMLMPILNQTNFQQQK